MVLPDKQVDEDGSDLAAVPNHSKARRRDELFGDTQFKRWESNKAILQALLDWGLAICVMRRVPRGGAEPGSLPPNTNLAAEKRKVGHADTKEAAHSQSCNRPVADAQHGRDHGGSAAQ